MPAEKNLKSELEMEARGRVWQRIEEAAIKCHALKRKHGLYTKIANDALRSNQTVADWKSKRSPVPRDVIDRLAQRYKVSAAFLLCLTENPEPDQDKAKENLRRKMNEIVNHVLDRVNFDVPSMTAIAMCDTALKGLMENKEVSSIYGEVFMHVLTLPKSNNDSSCNAANHGEYN